MEHEAWQGLLRQHRAIAVIRAPSFERGVAMAQAVAQGGMRLIEITWNGDRPAALVTHLRQALPHCWIGAGTLLSIAAVESAIAAGAQFCFMPHTDPVLIQALQRAAVPAIAGALTPTEILTAWQAGASSVKVFPITAVGGVAYLRQIQEPLGKIPLVPTGGVTVDNGSTFLAAGAIAIGLSSALFPSDIVTAGNWDALTQRAHALMIALQPFREGAS